MWSQQTVCAVHLLPLRTPTTLMGEQSRPLRGGEQHPRSRRRRTYTSPVRGPTTTPRRPPRRPCCCAFCTYKTMVRTSKMGQFDLLTVSTLLQHWTGPELHAWPAPLPPPGTAAAAARAGRASRASEKRIVKYMSEKVGEERKLLVGDANEAAEAC